VVCDEITQLDDNGQIMDDRIGIRMGSHQARELARRLEDLIYHLE
jgi:hypothetical protein